MTESVKWHIDLSQPTQKVFASAQCGFACVPMFITNYWCGTTWDVPCADLEDQSGKKLFQSVHPILIKLYGVNYYAAGTGPIFDIIYWSFFSWHQIYVIFTSFSEVTSYDQYVISVLCHMTWLSATICLWCQNDIKIIITQDQFLLKKSNLSSTAI